MRSIKALSLAPGVNDWLANSRRPRILHAFDHACNLINERREVLSIVTLQIRNGPFNLVVEDHVMFSDHLDAQSTISIRANRLDLGDLTINLNNAKLWSPRPDWELLHIKRNEIFNQLTSLTVTNYQPLLPVSLLTTFSAALANADIPFSLTLTHQLAGLGQGLTPAGDDFIIGALLAAWIVHPPEIAKILAKEITNIAAPLTTSLSAAWLRSAAKGEAGILWHDFLDALITGDSTHIQESIDKIHSMGETSGADALAGFFGTFISLSEVDTKLCPS